ncbi:hypothetical protein MMC30_004347 [Trapelia coarctata]|nr:hypothetical protein [Trapelia coarctata]
MFDNGFGLTEQASETIDNFQDSTDDKILPGMQTPKLSPIVKSEPSPSPKASDDRALDYLFEGSPDPESTGESPIRHPTPPPSNLEPLASSIPEGTPSNQDFLNFDFGDAGMNSSDFDFGQPIRDFNASMFDNQGMNLSKIDETFFQRFTTPEPVMPLSPPSEVSKHLPALPLTSIFQSPDFSHQVLPDFLPTTIKPQKLHQPQWYSAQGYPLQNASAPPYHNQAMPMGVPPTAGMFRAPMVPSMTQAPTANMTRTPVPPQDSTDFLPTMTHQGRPLGPETARELLGVGPPLSIPHGIDTSSLLYGNSRPGQFVIPSIEQSSLHLAGSPDGSLVGRPRVPKRTAKNLGKHSEEPSPSVNKRISSLLKEEPKIIHRLKPGYDSEKPWVKTNKNRGMNRRAGRIAAFKPEEVYTPLPKTHEDWDEFTYETTGELAGRRLYTPEEIKRFLYDNPRDLTIWLQRMPADSARRYGGMDRSICRFKNCCSDTNTIMPGFYRVAFDENSITHPDVDPQLNAGYVHLYCLEKFLDFPSICHDLEVHVDNRPLPNEDNGRNKMRYSTTKEVQAAQDFVRTCNKTGEAPDDYPLCYNRKRSLSHSGTLAWLLSVAKFGPGAVEYAREHQAARKKMSKHEVHLGNLEIYYRYRAKAKPKEPQSKETRRRDSTRRVSKKRNRDEYESDESPEPRRRDSTRKKSKRNRDDYESDESEEPPRKVSKKRHRDEYESDGSPEPKRRYSTRRGSKKSRRNEYESDEFDEPPRKHTTRHDSTRRDWTRKMSKKRRRAEYEADMSSEDTFEEVSDHERRRKRQKRSTKEVRSKPSKASKKRRDDTPESKTESETESESEYERAPTATLAYSLEDTAETEVPLGDGAGKSPMPLPNLPNASGEAPDGGEPLLSWQSTNAEGQGPTGEPPRKRKSSRMEETSEGDEADDEDEPPRKRRRSNMRGYESGEERERRRRKSIRDGERRGDRRTSRGSRHD